MTVTPPAQDTSTPEQVVSLPILNRKRGRIQQRDQAATLQRLAYDAAMSLKQACTNAETGQLTMDAATAVCVHKLIGAWDTAADRLRILRGKGLPASVKAKAGKPVQAVQPLPQD